MNSRPGIDSDRDAIIEQLADLDSSDPGERALSPEPPSTVRELKAELDTLLGEIHQPLGPDPFAEETGLRRAQELVRAIGAEPPQPKEETPRIGNIGPYELLEKLGEGGMGAVYKALHTSLDKVVALKVLPRERLHADAIARFKRKMKAVGKLDHQYIVRATDAGEADGDHFLVMEYVDGVDLSELIRRVGPLAAADACELMRQAAVGLQHAHQRGMVHRDIKPNNIMLAWGDELLGAGLPTPPSVKILDMGLALLSEPATGGRGDLTSTGQMMGTIEYMSPEQGLDTHNVDIRSDIYSLGATLYKLLCGKAPFAGEKYNTPGKILVALATEVPPPIGTKRNDLPAGLDAVVDRMLAKDAAQRYATSAEVAHALTPYAAAADLRSLAVAAQRASTPGKTDAANSAAPTAEFLSSPNTGTKSTAPLRDVQASPTAKAEPPNGSNVNLQPLLARLGKTAYFRPVLIATAAALLILATVVVYRIQTDQGTFVVKIEGKDAQVLLEREALVIRDKNSPERTWTIQAAQTRPLPRGEYKLEGAQTLEMLVTEDGGAEMKTREFTLKRKGEVRVLVTLEMVEPPVAKASLRPTTSDPNRRFVEWVLKVGGYISINVGSEIREITSVDQLPKEPWQPRDVILRGKVSRFADESWIDNFRDVTPLQSLTLENISITEATMDRMAAVPALRDLPGLALADTTISVPSVAAMKRFQNLTGVSIQFSRLTAAHREHLKELPKLEQLSLEGVQLADADLAEVRGLKLVLLSVGRNPKITDAGLVELKELSQLRDLRLHATKVTDAGLVHLKEMKQLAFLYLSDTAVTDSGMEHLKDMKQLVHLDLFQSKVTAEGVKKLSIALPGCKIRWDGGVIEPMAATDSERAMAEWVLSKGGDVVINPNGMPPVRIVKAADLPAEPFVITSVNLTGCQFASQEELARFASLAVRNRPELSVYLNSSNLDDAGLYNIVQCREVMRLYLEGTKVTDKGLSAIEQLPLLALHLPTQISDAGLRHVAKCPTLHVLNLSRCKVTDSGLAELKSLTKLQNIHVAYTDVTLAGLAMAMKDCHLSTLDVDVDRDADLELLSQWPKLAWFGSGGAENIGDTGLAHLANQPELQTLSLIGARVTDAGSAPLKQLKKLQTLGISGSASLGDGALTTLGDMPQLKNLSLNGTSVTDAGLTELEGSKDLETLSLHGTKVTEAGVKKLAAALPGCKIEWDGMKDK